MALISRTYLALILALAWPNAGLAQQGSADGHVLRIGGTGSAYHLMQIIAQDFKQTRATARFQFPPSLGSGGGLRALIAGALDLATTSRPLKPEERDAGAKAMPLCHSPLAFATSRRTPGMALTRARVVSIYNLSLTRWPDGARLRLVLRPRSETDTKVLNRHIAGLAAAQEEARKLRGLAVAPNDQENLKIAAGLEGSFAVTSLVALVTSEYRLTTMPLDGVAPTIESLAEGGYPLFKTLHLATGPDGESPLARDFVRFLGGKRGQAIMRANGCLPTG